MLKCTVMIIVHYDGYMSEFLYKQNYVHK